MKPAIAQRQLDAEEAASRVVPLVPVVGDRAGSFGEDLINGGDPPKPQDNLLPPQPKSQRFYGTIQLDALRLRRDVGQIVDEVLQHFTSLVDVEVEVTLDIQVRLPNGTPDHLLRTVSENCRVLRFNSHAFEDE